MVTGADQPDPRHQFPDDEEMRVSTETIYQAIYVQARGGLKRELAAALRSGRTRRNPTGHRSSAPPGLPIRW